jgi:endonuclease/exonuclease/phosphatase family metal-dependent hydrolase
MAVWLLVTCTQSVITPVFGWADSPLAPPSSVVGSGTDPQSDESQGGEGSSDEGSSDDDLRILSYNIHHGRGMDGQVDLSRIAQVISACSPDLVALQEVDQGVNRSGNVLQAEKLAELTGLNAEFAKQIEYDGGEYGQAILSRWPISDYEVIWLPGKPDREQRIAAIARIDIPHRPILFATTHLHHNNAEIRLEQTVAINRELATRPLPIILAGDLNAEPSSDPIAEMKKFWTVLSSPNDLNTFPSDRPVKQIDYVCFRPQNAFRTISTEVIAESVASDHRPILAVLKPANALE